MSSRRKGREVALMALYALDGVPSFEQYHALDRFWRLFDEPQVWHSLFTSKQKNPHPLDDPPLWMTFDGLSLEARTPSGPPFPKATEAKEFALVRINGIILEGAEIDRAISAASKGWRLERMAQVDRNILRLGAYELLYCDDIPAAVAISEALELSKSYSNAKARSFVNGVLDRVHRSREQIRS